MPRRPARIDVSGIDGVEAGADEGVEHGEGRILVRGPAEDVAAEDERRNLKA